jgi:3-dehydroquinate dehydratase-2
MYSNKKIIIINGPNLNLLGNRQPLMYGYECMEKYLFYLRNKLIHYKISLLYFQSNHEGDIIDCLYNHTDYNIKGIILNAGAYTHTSLAIADAITSIYVPVIEVHITNIYARKKIRHHSFINKGCKGCICGFGLKSYELALISLLDC